MILRLVRGRLVPGRLEQLRAGVTATLPDRIRETPGIVRAHVGVRSTSEGDEATFITAWSTPEAAMAVLGPDLGPGQGVPGITEHLATREIDHYEIDELRLFEPDPQPAVIRVAAGWIELGADVEIQQELRRRLGDLGGDVVEAYVGRRIRGRNVEVVLVTMWGRIPPDRSLDDAIWPDIAGRYEALLVEVYDAIPLTGSD